jgi:hypothetical protein
LPPRFSDRSFLTEYGVTHYHLADEIELLQRLERSRDFVPRRARHLPQHFLQTAAKGRENEHCLAVLILAGLQCLATNGHVAIVAASRDFRRAENRDQSRRLGRAQGFRSARHGTAFCHS